MEFLESKELIWFLTLPLDSQSQWQILSPWTFRYTGKNSMEIITAGYVCVDVALHSDSKRLKVATKVTMNTDNSNKIATKIQMTLPFKWETK